MGYFGFSYYEENQGRLKALQIREPEDGAPALPRRSRLHRTTRTSRFRGRSSSTRRAPSFKRPEVQAFIDYIFDNEGDRHSGEFVPLTNGTAEAGPDELRSRAQGGGLITSTRSDLCVDEGAAGRPPPLVARFGS